MLDEKKTPPGFGLFIIGNEILDGRKDDKHFSTARRLLCARHIPLRYATVLPDDPELIENQLRWAMLQPEPFFCCGGIGSTPDDYTRDCAARAVGVETELHPEGVAILKSRFGSAATPMRLKMVEFPMGAILIPNPFNQVPGFRVANGHFLPGFPEMAEPMMEWVLDTWYEPGEVRIARSLVLPGCKEADLVDLMTSFIADHPGVTFSSLPMFTETGTEVHFGLEGRPDDVTSGLSELMRRLDGAGVAYREATRS